VIALRPRSFGEVLDAGLTLAVRNFVGLSLVYAVADIMFELINTFAIPGVHESCATVVGWGHAIRLDFPLQACGSEPSRPAWLAESVVPLALLIIYPVGLCATLSAATGAALGAPINVWDSYRTALRRMIPIFGVEAAYFSVLAGCYFASILLVRLFPLGPAVGPVVLAALLLVACVSILPATYAVMALLFEKRTLGVVLGLGVRRAFGTWPDVRRTVFVVGFFTAFFAADFALSELLEGIAFLWSHSLFANLVLGIFLDLIFTTVIVGITVAVWIDARVRQDGLDIAMQFGVPA
jgi:hypothetical protein